jgi:hypothetical protein
MKTLLVTRLNGLFVLLLAAGFAQQAAHAGPMFIYMFVNPVSTAGAGVPAANGMTVSSSKSGSGTFQLYAVDDVTGSFGIKSYQIKLNGTITTFLNRSPNGQWNDTDAAGPYPEGFNDVRTAVAATGITSGGQNPTNPYFIKGFGITANNFVAANAGAPIFDSGSTFQITSGQWGNYSQALPHCSGEVCSPGDGAIRNAIFLAEGNYSGAPPTVDLTTPGATLINYFTSASGSGAATATQYSSVWPFFLCPEPATPTLIGLAVAAIGGYVGRRRG